MSRTVASHQQLKALKTLYDKVHTAGMPESRSPD
jgi:hypothetical protein